MLLCITNAATTADGFNMSFISIFANEIAMIYPQNVDPGQLMLANLVREVNLADYTDWQIPIIKRIKWNIVTSALFIQLLIQRD